MQEANRSMDSPIWHLIHKLLLKTPQISLKSNRPKKYMNTGLRSFLAPLEHKRPFVSVKSKANYENPLSNTLFHSNLATEQCKSEMVD